MKTVAFFGKTETVEKKNLAENMRKIINTQAPLPPANVVIEAKPLAKKRQSFGDFIKSLM